jgi:ABC-type Co2+ transport system permease subunit
MMRNEETRVLGFAMGISSWLVAFVAVLYADLTDERWPVAFALFVAAWGTIMLAAATLGGEDDPME